MKFFVTSKVRSGEVAMTFLRKVYEYYADYVLKVRVAGAPCAPPQRPRRTHTCPTTHTHAQNPFYHDTSSVIRMRLFDYHIDKYCRDMGVAPVVAAAGGAGGR